MTSNQVAYWNLQEQKRTNRANEGIRQNANAINYGNLVVNQRNATVNERNAATNEKNAKTNRIAAIWGGVNGSITAISKAGEAAAKYPLYV